MGEAGGEGGSLLEFLQGPVVRGAVLQILNLHGHHGAGEWPRVALLLRLRRQQLGRQRRVQGVGEQHKLELNLQRSDVEKEKRFFDSGEAPEFCGRRRRSV